MKHPGKIFGLALLAWLVGATALAREPDPFTEIDALLDKGKQERKSCVAWLARWKDMNVGDEMDIQSPSHRSAKQALAVLAWLEKRPGIAPSYLKARQLFEAKLEALRKHPDPAAVLARLHTSEIECDMLKFYQQAGLLLKDIKALPLEKSDAQRVRRLAMDYIRGTGSFFSLLKAGVTGSFLENFLEHAYTGANRGELLARAKNYSKRFEDKRASLEKEVRRLNPDGKGDNRSTLVVADGPRLSLLASEFQLDRELYAEFAGITKELAPAD